MNFFDFHDKVVSAGSGKTRGFQSKSADGQSADSDVLSVSELTRQIERILKAGFPASVHIKGEVSNYKHHGSSGHSYFTLKDSGACIDCVMFRSDAARLKFSPEDGMELIATGRVAVYPQRGRYQLYVTRLEPLGQGALELAFQQLCKKLDGEGLFAPQRKKPIPTYPLRLALVTSTQTAAVQDMLKVLRRYSFLKIFIYHVPVQGDGSAEQIVAAIDHLNHQASHVGGIDVILLGRGGGSLEDRWEFNEECVARAICASTIPIVTGIGHEVDVSIADLVADHHAHTPTEAAQVVVTRWRTVGAEMEISSTRLSRALRTIIQESRQRLNSIERHELFRRPVDRINSLRQWMDDAQQRMSLAVGSRLRTLHRRLLEIHQNLDAFRPTTVLLRLRQLIARQEHGLLRAHASLVGRRREHLNTLAVRLGAAHPRHAIRLNRERIESLAARLDRAMLTDLRNRQEQISSLQRHIEAVSPQHVLQRGYTITTLKKQGTLVWTAASIKGGERLVTRFADGQIESVAQDPRQPELFE